MKGLMATLIPKKDIVISTNRHFTAGKEYIAIYELTESDRGWITTDDIGSKHWLSPWDGKDHQDIHKEPWIVQNFYIIEVK